MDFTIKQGRYRRLVIPPMLNGDGSTYALASTTSRLMVKKLGEPDSEAAVDLYLVVNSGGTVTDSQGMSLGGTDDTVEPPVTYGTNSGAITVEFEDEDTQDVAPGAYAWEFVVIKAGKVEQGNAGTVTIIDTLIDDPETLPA